MRSALKHFDDLGKREIDDMWDLFVEEDDAAEEEQALDEDLEDELEAGQPQGSEKEQNERQIQEQEREIEEQMREYFDQLEQQDENEQVVLGDEADDTGRGEEEDEDLYQDDYGDEDEGVIRAKAGVEYEKDEMSDAEYEKLLREDMNEEELAQLEKEKAQKLQGSEEEDDYDPAMDAEIENNVFAEFREKSKLIREQEQKLLEDKPWQMKGEIRGHERPKDALVEMEVEFQHGVELKPKAPAKVSKEIERVIEQRILKEAFDDPREIVINQDLSWKKNFEDLNFEKDDRGLGALYEEEYKKNMLGLPVETKEQKMQQEILALYREISNTLDNLTNNSYVPMPLIAEKKKNKSDIETINLEEKIPITVKSTETIQPKQLYDPNHKDFLADVEKTHEDNKKSRQIAKRKIRSKLKDKRQKELVKQLDFKGQTKFEYNMVNKTKKDIEHEHANSKTQRENLTKSSDFFKVLQNTSNRKKEPVEVKPANVQAAELKKLKL